MSSPIELTLTAANQFSDPLLLRGNFNFSLQVPTSFVGTVVLQRNFNTSSPDWRNISSFTGPFEGQDIEVSSAEYRFGISPGDFTSGSITGRLEDAPI